jgi:Glycosyltransferase sugar-binding region containing DXD motif
LFVYGDVGGVPEGVTVLDGRSILPEERICRYGSAAGAGEGSLALFSNLFRYALLERQGGVWSDCDMVCLKPLEEVFAADHVIATEYSDNEKQIAFANNCLLKTPAGSPFIAECKAIAMGADLEKAGWGELGPLLVTAMVRKHALERVMAPPWQFCPLGHWEFPRLLQDAELRWPDATLAVHCFNEMWRQGGQVRAPWFALAVRNSQGAIPDRRGRCRACRHRRFRRPPGADRPAGRGVTPRHRPATPGPAASPAAARTPRCWCAARCARIRW